MGVIQPWYTSFYYLLLNMCLFGSLNATELLGADQYVTFHNKIYILEGLKIPQL